MHGPLCMLLLAWSPAWAQDEAPGEEVAEEVTEEVAAEPEPVEAKLAYPLVAAWRPVSAWTVPVGDRREETWRFRASFGGGVSTNPLHMSPTEMDRFQAQNGGSNLSVAQPTWPVDSTAGIVASLGIAAAVYADLGSIPVSASFEWEGQSVPRAERVASNPMALTLGMQLHEGKDGARHDWTGPQWQTWFSLALLANPYDYDRPLPVVDPALNSPAPTRYAQGTRSGLGGEATLNTVLYPGVVFGAYYRIGRWNYRQDLDPWDRTAHDVGGRLRWWIFPVFYVEAGGSFAGEVARGDSPATSKREPDPSWAGGTASLEIAYDQNGRSSNPFFVKARGELVGRDFRSGDRTDLSHWDRTDIGGSATISGGWADGGVALDALGLAISGGYTLNWNRTNLPLVIEPIDENNYQEHVVWLRVSGRFGVGEP